MPLVVGKLGDLFGLRSRHAGRLPDPRLHLLSIGFWAKPLITNATIGSKKKKEAAQ